jgi:hypothetical protein
LCPVDESPECASCDTGTAAGCGVFCGALLSGATWLFGVRVSATGTCVSALTCIRAPGADVEVPFAGGVDFTTGAEGISVGRETAGFGIVLPATGVARADVEVPFAGGVDFTTGAEANSGKRRGFGLVTPAMGATGAGVEFAFVCGADFTTGAEGISVGRETAGFRIVLPATCAAGADVEIPFACGADFTTGAEANSGETAGGGIVTPNATGADGAGGGAWISRTSALAA